MHYFNYRIRDDYNLIIALSKSIIFCYLINLTGYSINGKLENFEHLSNLYY